MYKARFVFFFVSIFFVTAYAFAQQTATPKYGNNSSVGHYIQVNGVTLYYEIYGKGEPLLMIHGNGGSIEAFSKQIPFFEKYYRVIAVDSRLQGKSGGSPDSISYNLMAADFNALLDTLHLDSVYVLGWSDGGINGLILAMDYPDKVKKLAETGANTVPDTTALSLEMINDMKHFVNFERASDTAIALTRMMIYEPNIPYSDLKKIKCPVLVMAGDHDIIKLKHTIRIFQSISNAELCIFPNSNHGVCQQHPELFNRTVLTFYKK